MKWIFRKKNKTDFKKMDLKEMDLKRMDFREMALIEKNSNEF